ncbi:hypothetical protein B0A55_08695 [Friedmanniomyces simplex]|uniref:Uncharacterized protein n=1 Tax=Friedmanniomyces simplex TaxID=329884 RepID=A0A4U0WRK3_9PEZI|nr:hypothetical protein B0A55_08695 [Friedmanniomyces simplex]
MGYAARLQCSLWVDFAGELGKSGRGFFTKHKELLRNHFGLDAWISHAVSDPGKLGWHDEESMTTLAYLTLPTTSAATEKWSQRVAGVVDTLMLPSENTSEHCISPPPQPTERSMARFARALRILNLKSYPLSWNQDLVAGSVPRDKSGGENGDDSREGFARSIPHKVGGSSESQR